MIKGVNLKSKKDLLKIASLVVIILVIMGIWVFKNSKNAQPIVENDNTDFALHVTDKIDIDKLKSYGLPILIDFGADSCIPCKEMAPVLKKLNEELRGKAIIRFVDVWKYQDLSEGYPISVIPTQVLFDSAGNPYTPKESEAAQFKMYSSNDTNKHIFTTHEGGMTEEMMRAALVDMGMKE